MLLWLPSFGLFLMLSPQHRALLRRSGPWLACAVAAICCLPIAWWNWQHEWVTFRHVGSQSGVDRTVINWAGPARYVAGQFGILFGVWFIAWCLAMWRCRPSRESDPNRRYLWFLSAPQFLFFALV